jgi:hypothetical protein
MQRAASYLRHGQGTGSSVDIRGRRKDWGLDRTSQRQGPRTRESSPMDCSGFLRQSHHSHLVKVEVGCWPAPPFAERVRGRMMDRKHLSVGQGWRPRARHASFRGLVRVKMQQYQRRRYPGAMRCRQTWALETGQGGWQPPRASRRGLEPGSLAF